MDIIVQCYFVPPGQSTMYLAFQGRLVALITNIEGRGWCRHLNYLGKPEHPRASTSDDVECFFLNDERYSGAKLHYKRGSVGFRKIAFEFTKRLDPDLPFTTTHALTVTTVRAHLNHLMNNH